MYYDKPTPLERERRSGRGENYNWALANHVAGMTGSQFWGTSGGNEYSGNPGSGTEVGTHFDWKTGKEYKVYEDPFSGERYYRKQTGTQGWDGADDEYELGAASGSPTYSYYSLPDAGSDSGDPYQNSHGEPVYTMDEFLEANKGLTRKEIINQRKDRSKTGLNSQPGGPHLRYVINPHDGRVLDMRHMLVVGKYASTIGNLVEAGQWAAGQASGMDRQDFYSNRVGYEYYRQDYGLLNVFVPHSFTKQLGYYFNNPRRVIYW